MMMTWYEIIKEQWSWGCYTSREQLDIYVNCGWITTDQADEIAQVGKYAPISNVNSDETVKENVTGSGTSSQPVGSTVQ